MKQPSAFSAGRRAGSAPTISMRCAPFTLDVLMLKFADALEARADEIGRLESRNTGKPVGVAIDEIPVPPTDLIVIRALPGAGEVDWDTLRAEMGDGLRRAVTAS